jgi:predicted PurR-regulated permease PerM
LTDLASRAEAVAPIAAQPQSAVSPPHPVIGGGVLPVTTRSKSTTGIFIMLFLVGLWLGKVLLVPLIASVLLSFLFMPVVRALAHVGIPRALSAMCLVIVTLGILGGGLYSLSGPASLWMERLPQELRTMNATLHTLRGPVDSMNAAAHEVETITTTTDANRVLVTTSSPTIASSLMDTATGLIAGILVTFLSLFFLLASGNGILDRLVRLVPALRDASDSSNMVPTSALATASETVLLESGRHVGRYLAVSMLINTTMACVLFIGFWTIGLPNPLLWSVVTGMLCFLPYVGAVIGIPLIALVSFIAFNDLSQALIAPLLYALCVFIEGNLVTPYVLGRSLAMSPIAIFLWMAFWAWLWGAAGALIAVPMLVMVKEFCGRIDNLKPIAHLIEP